MQYFTYSEHCMVICDHCCTSPCALNNDIVTLGSLVYITITITITITMCTAQSAQWHALPPGIGVSCAGRRWCQMHCLSWHCNADSQEKVKIQTTSTDFLTKYARSLFIVDIVLATVSSGCNCEIQSTQADCWGLLAEVEHVLVTFMEQFLLNCNFSALA